MADSTILQLLHQGKYIHPAVMISVGPVFKIDIDRKSLLQSISNGLLNIGYMLFKGLA